MPIVLFVATLLFFFAQSAQAQPQLRMATLEYPPYSSEHLPDGGSIVALTRRAFAVRGYPLQIDFLPWARARVELGNGNYQGALGGPRRLTRKGCSPHARCFTANWGCLFATVIRCSSASCRNYAGAP